MARIVLNTFGSFGDIHPYLAIAIELRRRGHDAVLATSEVYRKKVEAEGVGFAQVRPDVGELLGNQAFLERIWDPRHGSEYLIRDYLLPKVEDAYEDLRAACQGADLLVTHAAAYAGPIVAEALKLRWISIALQPAILFSKYDPSVAAPAPWMRHFYRLGRWPWALMLAAARYRTKSWAEPALQLRKRIGLNVGSNPVMEGPFSPFGTLALFSEHFAKPQPDWPPNSRATGFVFYDRRGEGFGTSSNNGLQKFLDDGSPPVLFTLGSSAVMQPGDFYQQSLAAALKVGVRAVLLIGTLDRANFPQVLPDSIYIADYAPYSEIMPRVALTVHQGGIGTTAQALRAGRPMLVAPWAHDQPDNAERLRKLGVSRTIARASYSGERAAREIERLLSNGHYRATAAQIGAKIASENGLSAACDALSAFLAN